ncbi:ABC transporter permease, partial [Streptococcus sobrinus]|uniref:ABC transporter permease n=1 Tax=Streptococcus sobrinus TaxID=1310 RepID=UPI00037C6A34
MFLAFQNLRKQKRHYFSFALMLFLTAVIVNLSLVLSFQTSKAYDQNFNRLKTAQLNVLISQKQDSKDLLKEIDKIQGVTLVERHQGIFTKAKVHHFAGTDFEMTTVFYDSSQKRNLNRFELSKSSKVASQSVYIPNYISKLGGFPLGSKIRYTIGKKDYTYSVAGTVEEMQYGNYGTNVIGIYLPHNAYQSLFKEEEAHSVAEYSLKVSSSSDLSVVKKKLTSLLSDKGIAAVLIKDSKTVKQARTMMSTLLIAIFIAVAGIVFIISLFLSAFRIQNHLKSEVVNMGVLKAMGYTSAKIIFSEVLPYLLVAMIATVTGVLTSYLVLPFLASFLAVQSGFSFQPTFDSYALCLIVVFVTGVAGGLTYLCARKIHRFNPIDAVRRTDSTRRFSNHFSLANSKLGISGALILKQVFASFWQNMLLFVLTVGLMMLLAFSGTLLYNTAGKPDNFLRTLSEEFPSAIFTVDKPQELQNIKKELKSDSRVKQVLDYSTQSVNGPDGGLTAFVTPDFSKLTNDIIYKGR